MMRNKTSSALQKTYDDCYLICSTAVYFEGQGNEAEALRSWRSALDQIYYHNAYRVPANYIPKTETEKALMGSLREMELQCKERVDLLEALKRSRQEQSGSDDASVLTTGSGGSNGKLSKTPVRTPRQSTDSESAEKGYIGEGTIPAVTFPDLTRAAPPVPQRPNLLTKTSSQQAVVGRKTSASSLATLTLPSKSPVASTSLAPPPKDTSRNSSPDKGRSMLTTLRARTGDKKLASRARSSAPAKVEVPSKAATLAWNAVSRPGRDRVGRSLGVDAGGSSATLDSVRKNSFGGPLPERPNSTSLDLHYDTHTRTLVNDIPKPPSPLDLLTGPGEPSSLQGHYDNYPFQPPEVGQGSGDIDSKRSSGYNDLLELDSPIPISDSETPRVPSKTMPPPVPKHAAPRLEPVNYPTYFKEYPDSGIKKVVPVESQSFLPPIRRRSPAKSPHANDGKASRISRKPIANTSSPRKDKHVERGDVRRNQHKERADKDDDTSSRSFDDDSNDSDSHARKPKRRNRKQKQKEDAILADDVTPTSDESEKEEAKSSKSEWDKKVKHLMKHLPRGVDENAAKQIFNEIVVKGDEVHWDDVAGLEVAKKTLKEAVVYPFLRPDLFVGLREPARGMLLFGPPGTGKTMLARAVATESRSTFFSISASSLTSKYLGESEKLVRALFSLAKELAPSIIFVDEIDSLLSARSGSSEHEATRRLKTEFLIQWSDLQRAAAGREQSEKDREKGDASRVLVLAATNLPWDIDEAARRRFVRRQYIPLPEDETREAQLRRLLGHQKHSLNEEEVQELVKLTDGFSGSDITALAKDAAMGPLRALGEKLLYMSMDDIRPIQVEDFQASLNTIRPSVSKQGLKQFEDWAKEFGERGG